MSTTKRIICSVLAALVVGVYGELVIQPELEASGPKPDVAAKKRGGFTIRDLGHMGGDFSRASGINQRGEVVGWGASAVGEEHAFLLDRGMWTDLGTLGCSSAAYGNNDRGQVVGHIMTDTGKEHPVLWENGVMTDLASLWGDEYEGRAVDINNRGQVVGYWHTGSETEHAFLWEDGVTIYLGNLGGTTSEAFGINDRGQVVGTSRTAAEEGHAFLWERGVMTDLHEATDHPNGTFAGANAINNRGQVVGFCSGCFGGNREPVLWEDNVIILLGEECGLGGPGGACWSEPISINDRGQVVGVSRIFEDDEWGHAFLWENGVMTGLGSLGGSDEYESWASGINNRGQVVGGSWTELGAIHAVLWE